MSELNRLNAQESELKIQKEELIKKLRTQEEELFNAKIINKGKSWQDMNVIKWKFRNGESTYTPKRDEEAAVFFAKHLFDKGGKAAIDVSQEIEERDLEWLKQR